MKNQKKRTLIISLGVIIVVLAILAGIYFYSVSDKKNNAPELPEKELISLQTLEGNYILSFYNGEEYLGSNAAILKTDSSDSCQLLVTRETGPQIYHLQYIRGEHKFTSSEIGEGIVTENKELNKISITFNVNYTTWELTK